MPGPPAAENGELSSSGPAVPQKRGISEEGSPDPLLDNRKRRTGGPSSRGVANLTPDQLAKKRANDREAQRAIRERTKNQIESLERRIKDLTSQQPYQELQNVLEQKRIVEAENADMRKRLAQIMDLIHPVVGQPGLDNQQYTSPYVANRPGSSHRQASDSPAMGLNSWHAPPAPMAHEARPYLPQSAQRQELPSLEPMPERRGLDYILDNGPPRAIPPMSNGLHNFAPDSETYHHPPRRPEEEHSIQPVQHSLSVPDQHPASETTTNTHAYSTPPLHTDPTCPVDTLILDHLAQYRLGPRVNPSALPSLLGPPHPQFSLLLDPSLVIFSYTLSRIAYSILTHFPEFPSLPEKAAFYYIIYLLLRWQISLDKERYEQLPEWLRPSAGQIVRPHAAWVDLLPWPRTREDFVDGRGDFEGYWEYFVKSVSVKWPHEPMSCLVRKEAEGSNSNALTRDGYGEKGERDRERGRDRAEEWTVNPMFEEHIRKIENWGVKVDIEVTADSKATYAATSEEANGQRTDEKRQ